MLKKFDLPWLYYGLVLSQALHSTEEVLTRLWAWMPRVTAAWHARVNWIPVMPGWGETNFAVANLLIVTGLLALIPFVFQRQPWAMKLAFWIAAIEIANGVGHLTAALFVRGYFPGALAGIGLLVFGIWFVLRWRMERI